jgi:sensor domain CHASE-containing protein
MGIEPTSEPWEVLNIPIPFSSERHAATLTRNLAVGRTVHSGPPAPLVRAIIPRKIYLVMGKATREAVRMCTSRSALPARLA